MSQLFEQFPKSTKEDWIQVLTKELKGADFESSLIKYDELEDVKYPSFFHKEDSSLEKEIPGVFPYKRAFSVEQNDWSIVGEIKVLDEKIANEKALDLLMKGNTALHFQFSKNDCNLEILFAGIELEYIKTFVASSDLTLLNKIQAYFKGKNAAELFLNYNPLSVPKAFGNKQLRSEDLILDKNIRNFEVDAYSVQQAGANCSQEIAFALNLGHEYLSQQISQGRTPNEAVSSIHFTFGVGSTYLFEIAKLRAFRLLWAKITSSYQVKQPNTQISSKIGFLNKSLQDPYTNLLRQTTEVMSAVLGGANHIINQAYDKQSTAGSSEIAERMATNISLILKEESYLEKVLDAVGGSYALETLTENLADKAWSLFQEIEAKGDINTLIEQIKHMASKRIELYREKKKTLIGITKFPNPEKSNLSWKSSDKMYFGLKELVIEKELN